MSRRASTDIASSENRAAARAWRSRVLSAALVLGALAAAWRLARESGPRPKASPTLEVRAARAGRDSAACPVRGQRVTVRGDSLGALAPAGTQLLARFGYYACHAIERGDLVWYRRAASDTGAAKLVKGLPGDRVALAEQDGDTRLLINGEPPRTSTGEHYFLDRRARRMLAVYIDGYHGRIPKDAYLLLADRSERVADSRSFGLAHREDLLARLEPAETP